MNEENAHDSLERLFAAARPVSPAVDRLEFGFTTRLQAQLRAARSASSASLGDWAWRLCPFFATIVLALAVLTATEPRESDTDLQAALSTPDTWPELSPYGGVSQL